MKRHTVSVRCFQLQPVKWNVNEVLQKRGFTFFCFWIFIIEFINWYRGWCRNSGHIPNIGWHVLITEQNDVPFLRQQNQNVHFVLFFFAKLFKLSHARHKPPRKINQTFIWRLGTYSRFHRGSRHTTTPAAPSISPSFICVFKWITATPVNMLHLTACSCTVKPSESHPLMWTRWI